MQNTNPNSSETLKSSEIVASKGTDLLTAKRLEILELLSLTMLTAHLLVAGGIIQRKSSLRNNLRSGQKILRNLHKAGYLGFHSYVTRTGRQKYYFLQKAALPYHEIQPGILTHDSITALFLTHLFLCCRSKGIQLRWYPPFMINAKESDGGAALTRNGETVCSLILETDTGTQDFPEVREKLESFVTCLPDNSHRKIVFLTVGEDRKKNLQEAASEILRKKNLTEYENRILCLIPTEFPPDMDIFSILEPPFKSKAPAVPSKSEVPEKEVPSESEVPSEGTSKHGSVSEGTSKDSHPKAEISV